MWTAPQGEDEIKTPPRSAPCPWRWPLALGMKPARLWIDNARSIIIIYLGAQSSGMLTGEGAQRARNSQNKITLHGSQSKCMAHSQLHSPAGRTDRTFHLTSCPRSLCCHWGQCLLALTEQGGHRPRSSACVSGEGWSGAQGRLGCFVIAVGLGHGDRSAMTHDRKFRD